MAYNPISSTQTSVAMERSKMKKKIKLNQIGKVSLRNRAQDTHLKTAEVLISPRQARKQMPANRKHYDTVLRGRQMIQDILDHKDRRLMVVAGPCSIHDPKAAFDYASRLRRLAGMVQSTLLLVMRVYFEKPRTTVGWKGLINDPDMNDSFHIDKGLLLARRLLLRFTEMGLPTATEALDPIIPQYIADLISWSAIGARTTESQTHREMASGLSMPVGLKNATDGGIQVALNGIQSARTPHHFLGIDPNGRSAIFRTTGNPYAHIVLRGGGQHTNFDPVSIRQTEEGLRKAKLPLNIVVDCSHGNSNKDYRLQGDVFRAVVRQAGEGNTSIIGAMLESNIKEGNQPLTRDLKAMRYGVSVTDACISWETTEELILEAHKNLKAAWGS
jgi:3-deoxy-7-phosphoheptulonate synthase